MNTKKLEEVTRTSIRRSVVISCTFLTFSLLIYLPLEIFTANVNEFSIESNNLYALLGLAWLISTTTAVVVVSFIPSSFRYRIVSFVFAVGFLIWLQGSFLIWDYGPLDGSEINWSQQAFKGVIDAVVWTIGLAIAAFAPIAVIKACSPLTILVALFQSISLTTNASVSTEIGADASKRAFTIDYENRYRFSTTDNVIVIVLDAFQSDIFEEIITKDQRFSELFPGFTYFRNSLAGGNYTELAVPALLTGQIYDNSQKREDFLRSAFLDHGISTILKEADFQVELYPWVGWGNESIYFHENVASNFGRKDAQAPKPAVFTEKNVKEAIQLIDISLFRSVPHYLKKFIHNDYQWFIGFFASHMVPDNIKQVVSTENQFEVRSYVDKLPDHLSTSFRQPVFKYLHYKGAHSPLTVNAELEFTDDVFEFSRENYIFQAKANLLTLGAFFKRMMEAGIYDTSFIAVIADHGSGESRGMYLQDPGLSRDPYPLSGTSRNFLRDKARALPLTLIKRKGLQGLLETSDAPVTVTDLPATILSELGIQRVSAGRSMFDVDALEPRVRFHSAFEFRPNKQSYVDEITLYRVSGHSWSNDSWSVERLLKKKE